MRTSQIPVLFVSTHADLDDVQKAYNAGANAYLVTPYDPAVLEEKIEHLVADEVKV
jgi:CheY-like chemotaxis protein